MVENNTDTKLHIKPPKIKYGVLRPRDTVFSYYATSSGLDKGKLIPYGIAKDIALPTDGVQRPGIW
jgi:hypothetical protein